MIHNGRHVFPEDPRDPGHRLSVTWKAGPEEEFLKFDIDKIFRPPPTWREIIYLFFAPPVPAELRPHRWTVVRRKVTGR